MDKSVSEEAIQAQLAQLRQVFQNSTGNINFAEGSDPVWNEAVRRLNHEIIDGLMVGISDLESLAALQAARRKIDHERG